MAAYILCDVRRTILNTENTVTQSTHRRVYTIKKILHPKENNVNLFPFKNMVATVILFFRPLPKEVAHTVPEWRAGNGYYQSRLIFRPQEKGAGNGYIFRPQKDV